jgi:AcrR family transcriptional regulator
MAADTRDRMIDATVEALQRHGVAGMSFTEVLDRSGAARGAIYHHFPGGKTELVNAAAERNGADVRAHLAALPAGTPHEVVEAFLAMVRPVLAQSATGGGCAVAAVATGGDERVAARVFDTWTAALADRLHAAGTPRDEADDLATALLGVLEGAHVLCRAAGTLEPFERAGRAMLALTRP